MNKYFILGLLLFVSSIAVAQVGIGTNAPDSSDVRNYSVINPQGALHLQGIHYLNDSTNRNLGLVLPIVDGTYIPPEEEGDEGFYNSNISRVITPAGTAPVEGTLVFDQAYGGIRLRTDSEWEDAWVDKSNIDQFFDYDVYGGLNLRAKKVSAGNNFSVYIGLDDKALYATGYNSSGQLGTGSTSNSPTFSLVFARSMKDVAAGYAHTVVATAEGELYTWGSGTAYATGLNVTANRVFPQKVTDWPVERIAKRVEAGYYNSLVLDEIGKVYFFGRNTEGLSGRGAGDNTHIRIPTGIAGLSTYVIVDISMSRFGASALTEDGKVYVWGNQQYGRLGTGNSANSVIAPTQILADKTIKQVAMGNNHGLAVTSDGKELWGWGAASPIGHTTATASPIDVTANLNGGQGLASDEYIISIALSRFDAASATTGSSVVITNKNVYAAGSNTNPQRMGLGFFAGTVTEKYSPGSSSNETVTGFQPLYNKTIYQGTSFVQASIGVLHSLLLQTYDEQDGTGGYGYGMGSVNVNQLGNMDTGIGKYSFPVLLKR
ncbi:MAG: hypothetical protein LIO93_02105 [Bacteroidales bacterium]|nr:hypothetical protein [Bacteroidales bacterium]